MFQTEYEAASPDPFMSNQPGSMGPPTHPAPHNMPPTHPAPHNMPPTHPAPHNMPHPDNNGMMTGQRGMMGMPGGPPVHPGMNGMHSQSYQDLTRMGPGPSPYHQNPMGHPPHLGMYPERRANSLPSTPRKSVHGRLHDTTSETNLNRTGSDKNVSSGTGTGKSKVLPKEVRSLRDAQHIFFPKPDHFSVSAPQHLHASDFVEV